MDSDFFGQSLPKPLDLIPLFFSIFVLKKIRNPYAIFIGASWIGWYFIGMSNVIASSVVLGNYYEGLATGEATELYFSSCLIYFLGILAHEKATRLESDVRYGSTIVRFRIPPLVSTGIIFFPFLWVASIYFSLGYIPILRQGNIVDDIYQINYGPFYAYGAITIISILRCGQLAMNGSIKQRRIYGLLTLALIALSMADGKRAFALVGIMGLVGLSFKAYREKTWTKVIPAFLLLIIFVYIGISLIRSDSVDAVRFDAFDRLSLIGVEFRDFVYSVNYLTPGNIANYEWLTSSIASVTNGVFLAVLGYDKTQLVNLDSAHAWATIWGSNFGIRTGIFSELWFAYHYVGLAIIFLYGIVTSWLLARLRDSQSDIGNLFFSAIFGLLVINITNQSTFTFGVLPVFAYVYAMIILSALKGGYRK